MTTPFETKIATHFSPLRRPNPYVVEIGTDKIGEAMAATIADTRPARSLHAATLDWHRRRDRIYIDGECLDAIARAENVNIEDDSAALATIWRKYLLQSLPEAIQNIYVQALFDYAHSGAVEQALLTANNIQIRVDPDSRYWSNSLPGSGGGAQGIVNYTFNNGAIEINAIEKFQSIVECNNDVDRELINEKKNNSSEYWILYEGHSKFVITLDEKNEPSVRCEWARDYIYSEVALRALFPQIYYLFQYVHHYIMQGGHDRRYSAGLFEIYPDIALNHKKNPDRIFYYLREQYPNLVKKLAGDKAQYQEQESHFRHFILALDYLSTPGQENFALKTLKEYYAAMRKPIVNMRLTPEDIIPAKLKMLFHFFKKEGAFANSGLPEIDESILLNRANEEIYLYILRKTPKMRGRFFPEHSKGLGRAFAYKALMIHATDEFTKKIILFALLSDTDSNRLRSSVSAALQPWTIANLKVAINQQFIVNNMTDYDFKHLQAEVIDPIIVKARTFANKIDFASQTHNMMTVFSDELNKIGTLLWDVPSNKR